MATTDDSFEDSTLSHRDDNDHVHGGSGFDGAEREVVDALAGKENRAVSYLRIVVLVFLALASIGFSVLASSLTKSGQTAEFQNAFEGYAIELIQVFHTSMEKSLEALDSLGIAITAHALATNSTFP